MHTYLIVTAKPRRIIPPEVVHALGVGEPRLMFEPTDRQVWADPTGRSVIHSWQCPNPGFGITSHVRAGVDGFTGFVGHLWPKPDGWARPGPWVDQLAERCRGGSARQQAETLAGVFSLASVDGSGRGYVVSDPLGLGVIYVGGTADYDVVSSSPHAAAWALAPTDRTPALDPLGAAWLAYVGYPVGDRTGYAGVRTLPQGSFVALDPPTGATVASWSAAPWHGDEGEASVEELVDSVRAEITAHLQVVLGLPGTPKVVGLTGGKDSRLILAVLLGAGLAHRVSFRTLGAEALPDVSVARELAARFGLDHSWGRFESLDHRPYPERATAFVLDTAGSRNLWDQGGSFGDEDGILVSGLLGETLRSNFPRTTGRETWAQVDQRFEDGLRFGRPGFATPEAWDVLRSEARSFLEDRGSSPRPPIDQLDAFYLNSRIRRWYGAAEAIERSNRVVPLYALTGIRSAFALGGAGRHAQTLHRDIIRATCPELLDEALAGSEWAALRPPTALPPPGRFRPAARRLKAALTPRSPVPLGPTVPVPPVATPPAAQETANRQHRNRTLATTKPFLHQALGASDDQPIWEIVDRTSVLGALDRLEELEVPDRVRLYGAVSAAVWLGQQER